MHQERAACVPIIQMPIKGAGLHRTWERSIELEPKEPNPNPNPTQSSEPIPSKGTDPERLKGNQLSFGGKQSGHDQRPFPFTSCAPRKLALKGFSAWHRTKYPAAIQKQVNEE